MDKRNELLEKINQLKKEIKMDIEDFIELDLFSKDYDYEILLEKENKGKISDKERCQYLYKRRVNNKEEFKILDVSKDNNIKKLNKEGKSIVLLDSSQRIFPLFPIQLSGKVKEDKIENSCFIERMIEKLPKINNKTGKKYTYKTILKSIYNGVLDFENKIDFFNNDIFKVFLNFIDKDGNILFIIPMSICFDKKFCSEENIYRYGTFFNEKRIINIIDYLGYEKFQKMLMNKTSRLYRRFNLKETIFEKERFNTFKYCFQKERNFGFVDNINVQERTKYLKRLKTFFSGTYKLTTFLSLEENELLNRKKYKIDKSNKYEYKLSIVERKFWRIEDIYKVWLENFIDDFIQKIHKNDEYAYYLLTENKISGNIFKEIDGEKYNISTINNGFWNLRIYWKKDKNEGTLIKDIGLTDINTDVYIFDYFI